MEGLIVNGAYGSGKTTLVEEVAEQMAQLGLAYGAIDLDGWDGSSSPDSMM